MEQINTIDKISAVYRNTAEEARQELNKVQQKITASAACACCCLWQE